MASTLWRVSEGSAESVTSATAVVAGRYDASNWGHDWLLVTARSASEASGIAKAYDAALNAGRVKAPRFLKSLSRGWRYLNEARVQ